MAASLAAVADAATVATPGGSLWFASAESVPVVVSLSTSFQLGRHGAFLACLNPDNSLRLSKVVSSDRDESRMLALLPLTSELSGRKAELDVVAHEASEVETKLQGSEERSDLDALEQELARLNGIKEQHEQSIEQLQQRTLEFEFSWTVESVPVTLLPGMFTKCRWFPDGVLWCVKQQTSELPQEPQHTIITARESIRFLPQSVEQVPHCTSEQKDCAEDPSACSVGRCGVGHSSLAENGTERVQHDCLDPDGWALMDCGRCWGSSSKWQLVLSANAMLARPWVLRTRRRRRSTHAGRKERGDRKERRRRQEGEREGAVQLAVERQAAWMQSEQVRISREENGQSHFRQELGESRVQSSGVELKLLVLQRRLMDVRCSICWQRSTGKGDFRASWSTHVRASIQDGLQGRLADLGTVDPKV
jgi:hypothetical protein